MKPKNIITIILLLFVAGSVVYLVAGSPSLAPKPKTNQPIGADPNAVSQNQPTAAAKTPDVIVYYLHNNVRCVNCRKFEAYTADVIEKDFANQVKTGRLALKILNYEKPENAHFVDDYKLVTKAVVVVKMQGGKQADWKNLDKIWVLVNDETAFKNYIRDEVKDYLGAN
jgi:hypothetical protein